MPLSAHSHKRIYTLGPKGTFSNQAASMVKGPKCEEIRYCTTLQQITKAVEADADSLGVLPIENSTSGIVALAQDSLIQHDVVAIGELFIDVHYALIGKVPPDQVSHYYCHAVAFNQCQNFETDALVHAEVIYSNSNVHSADLFLEHQDQPVAAIVPLQRAQEVAELRPFILAENIQDIPNNRTRFLVIEKAPEAYEPDFTKEKTSIYVKLHEDRHSLLFELLREFHVFNINLCRLESRPVTEKNWKYGFFIDFFNNHRTGMCLEALRSQQIDYKILGSFSTLKP